MKHRLHRNFIYGTLGAAGLAVLFGLWMVIGASSVLGFGAILNLVAAGAVAGGAIMKAKEEKVF